MNRPALVASLALGTALIACGGVAPASPPAAEGGLAGRTFVADELRRGGEPVELVRGTSIRLEFGADGQLGAHAGCNHISGTWSMDNDRLRFTAGATTAMGCDGLGHRQDEWLVQFLAAGPDALLDGATLRLAVGDTEVHLTDRQVADPDRPLVGPVWNLTAIRHGDAVASLPAGTAATLAFQPDQFGVDTGCNQATGEYRVEGDTVHLARLATTRMACPGPVGDLERELWDVLDAETFTWRVHAGNLELDAGNRGLSFSAP